MLIQKLLVSSDLSMGNAHPCQISTYFHQFTGEKCMEDSSWIQDAMNDLGVLIRHWRIIWDPGKTNVCYFIPHL